MTSTGERDRAGTAIRALLAQAQHPLYSLLRDTRLMGLVLDTELRVVYANDVVRDKLGWPQEAMQGEPWFERFVPPDRDVGAHFMTALQKGEVPRHFENEVLMHSGERRLVEWDNAIIRADSGELLGVASLGRDLTEARAAERALRAAEEQYRLVLRATNDVVWDYSLLRNELYITPAIRTVFRFAPDVRVNDFDWWAGRVHPDDRQETLASLSAAIDGGASYWSREYRFLCGDGSDAVVFDRGFILRDDDGRPLRMIGAMQDITARKKMELELARHERRFRALIDASTDAILIADAEGRVSYANRATETVIGYAPSEIIGADALQVYHPDELAAARQSLERLVAQPGSSVRSRRRVRHRDGRWRDVDITAVSLLDDPAVHGIVTTVRDVTDELVLHAELAQAQKMEALGRLAGGIAHDFNNVLTVISANAELARASLPADAPAHEEIAELLAASQEAASFAGQLLSLSRRRSPTTELLDLNEIVGEARALFARALPENVRLSLETIPQPLWVRAAPGQIDQILMNLVVNARDALPDGGSIVVAINRRDRWRTHDNGDSWAVLTVSDTGLGMDDDTRARAFDPFFTTKPVGQGSGLGLSIVYSLMNQMAGSIEVESAVGRGATFTLHFPLEAHAEEHAAAPSEPLAHGTAGGVVLLIEDAEHVRRALARVLRRDGFTVIEAANGQDALELVAAGVPGLALVITDMVMPGLSGSETAARLKQIHPAVPVLFISGYAPDDVAGGPALPVDAELLQKPFALEVLTGRARALIAGGRRVDGESGMR